MKTLVFKGTQSRDEFYGGDGNERIYGLGGGDYLSGMGGNDYIDGGIGNDLIRGGRGRDLVKGGSGNDTLDGSGNDKLYGGTGNDELFAWKSDRAFGGSGYDTFEVQDDAIAIGGQGDDRFIIRGDRPTVQGGAGHDVVEFDLQCKHFTATYVEGMLFLRIVRFSGYDGFYRPSFHLTDQTIEKIAWKDLSITPAAKSAPTITRVYAQADIEEGGTTTAPLQTISGRADPFARVTIIVDGVVIGQTAADYEGRWHTGKLVDLPEGPVSLTVSADYGDGTPSLASESFDFIIGMPGGEVPGQSVYELESDEVSFLSTPTTDISFGYRTFALGDVNDDGIDDWLVPISGYDASTWNGGAYVIYGRDGNLGRVADGVSLIDPTALTADEGFLVKLGAVNYHLTMMSSAGDLNGDGNEDLLFSTQEDGAVNLNVVYSGIGQLGTIDGDGKMSVELADLSEDQLLTIQLRHQSPTYEFPVDKGNLRSVGDVNGDGIADLVVGISDSQGSDAYLIYGGTSLGTSNGGKRTLDVETMDASQGVHLLGYGLQIVEAAGDVNGDGLNDFIVGARYNNIPAIAVVFGNEAGIGVVTGSTAELDLRDLTPDQGLLIKDSANNFVGNVDIENLGDFNGDGYDDLLIQSHDQLTVAYGSKTGFGEINNGARELIPDELTADQGFTIDTKSESWQSPPTISKLGDFNGDGFDDFAVLRPRSGDYEKIFIILGTDQALVPEEDGKISLTLQDLKRSQALAYSFDCSHISAAGDLNGDGYDDLVAEPGYFYYGPAVIYGHSTSSTTALTRTGTSAADILIGKAGADILDGNGGADILRGGGGADTIRIGDATFEKINAGRGTNDTVEFDGANITLDARDFGNGQLRGIEAFDLTGSGDNTLILTAFDVFQLSSNRNGEFSAAESANNLVVRGDAGDTLELIDHPTATWMLADMGVDLAGASGGDFDIYNLIDGARVLASIAVGETVTLIH